MLSNRSCTSEEELEVQVLKKFRKTVGSYKEEVIAKILYKKKFCDLYGSFNIVKVVKFMIHLACSLDGGE